MAATHKKQLTTTVRPGSLLSNQDIIAVVTGDTDIGGRIAGVNDLRFSTAAGLWLEWMPIAFSLSGGALTATFRIVRPTILSSEDLVTEIHYGGTPDGAAPGPASTLTVPNLSLAYDLEANPVTDWSGNNKGFTIGTSGYAIGSSGGKISNGLSQTQRVAMAGASPTRDVAHTLMFWYRWETIASLYGFPVLVDGANGASLYHTATTANVYVGTSNLQLSKTVSQYTWTHVAISVDSGSRGTAYIDGVACGSVTGNGGEYKLAGTGIWFNFFLSGGRGIQVAQYDDVRVYAADLQPDPIAYYVDQVNSPGTWGSEISLTGFKRLLKRRSLGQELYNGSLICG